MPQPPSIARRSPHGLILAVVCVAQFMVVLDVSIVNVALPDMRTTLHMSESSLQWVINAYTLTFAGFLLLGGRAADLYGRRRLFLIGLVVFSSMSLLGGLAQNGTELIAARAAQGIGGAILSPATLTILTTTFTDQKGRARALGLWSAVAGAGGATGVLAGGILTDLLSWRWILFINVPIGVVTALVARLALVESRAEGDRPQLDWAGAVSATVGLSAVVYGIVSTDQHSWGSARVLGPILAGLALLVVFVVVEARHPSPLAPLRLFRARPLVGANLIMIVLGSIMFGVFFFLSLYAQEVLGYSPLKTGVAFVPMPIAIIIGTQLASRLVGRVGPRLLLMVGPSLTAIGLVLLSRLAVDSSYPQLALSGALTTFGVGLCFVPLTMEATGGVAARDAGLASGLINTTRQIGGSIGLAVLATVATSHAAHVASRGAAYAQTAGYNRAYEVAAVLAVAAAVCAAVILPRGVRTGPLGAAEQAVDDGELVPDADAVLERT
ncbi:MAG TPA: MFS transporter [Mycobacteriales bacterium]|jgi:EmrB/QacA subfamily drug resistance transporter|nr:MFS transporter [Mycobacteriales bacterium]